MKRKQIRLWFFCILVFSSPSLHGDAQLETWFDLNLSYEFSPKTTIDIKQEWETADGLRDFYWYHIEAALRKNIGSNFELGAHTRYIRRRNSLWVHELRPGVSLRYAGEINNLYWYTRAKVDYRAVEKENNRAMIHYLLGAYLAETADASLYVSDEISFNYYGNKQVDFNIATLGIEGPISTHTQWGVYFSNYVFKKESNAGWSASNALGFAFNLFF